MTHSTRWPLAVLLVTLAVADLASARTAATTAPSSPTSSFTGDDYDRHVARLRERLPDGFTIVVQEPFVVIGDEAPDVVRRRARDTVGWAVTRLKRAYFPRDPGHILDIYLFKDERSYRRHTKELLDHEPGTPFGYYAPSDRALVMNIATGGGTLVHEIVHPFVEANFPTCPAWFNEGLGSLYEQSAGRGDEIIGLTNWRLAGLQRAIRDGRVPTFKEMMSTTSHAFYEMDRGTNYAQARYLCYYLQEKGLLQRFYHRFAERVAEDPTGYETLREVLGVEDMGAFQKEWEAYVMELRFP